MSLVEFIQVDFSLAVGESRLDASVHVPAGAVTLTQILPAIQNLTSNIVESMVQIVTSEGRTVSCREGCGACCRQLVPLSLFEAEALGDWMRALPGPVQQQLQQRFHETLMALSQHGLLERLDPDDWVEGSDRAKQLAIDYLAAKIACPFLVDECCGIHAIRPLACREHLVTSPPEFCANPTEESVEGVPMPLRPSTGLFRLGTLLEKGGVGWIPLVFLLAWMKSGSRPGERISGLGPDVLHEFVKAFTSTSA